MIELINLRKEFDNGAIALNDINLKIDKHSFIALLGPSGCGKSTTLMSLAGIYKPSSGSIMFDGRDVTDFEPKDRNIGMVFQSYALYPHMSVIDNIAFPLKQQKVGKEERYARSREVAKLVKIEQFLDRKPSQLSGGQQQRVAMARALVKNPSILLLDEPMSNLDARLKIEVREEIKRIQKDTGVTAVIVTHDQEEAMAIADKIAILDDGRIQQFGTPEELYSKPKNLFVAHFMGNPPMNFIDCKITKENDEICLKGNEFIYYVSDEIKSKIKNNLDTDVKIGVRPHNINIVDSDVKNKVKLRIAMYEDLGREIIVKSFVQNCTVRALVSKEDEVSMKKLFDKDGRIVDSIYVSFDENINIFESASGSNLVV